jgi:hypothetical protein
MADTHHPPLNYEASNTRTNPQSSTTLPPEVSQCLKNARFLHLATISSTTSPSSSAPIPHVSLMNYTFLPTYHVHGPVIIMTTNAQSLKTQNLLSNPNVSILVHDWVSHRPPTTTTIPGTSHDSQRAGSPPAAATRSSLASLLLNLNTSALSSISTTITGQARFLERGSEEEKWCKEMHLANNTFGDQGQVRQEAGYFSNRSATERESRESETASCYIEGDDVRVVIVPVREGRTADWKGGVKDWVVVEEGNETGSSGDGAGAGEGNRGRSDGPMVNGIISR